jgi:DNA mismatch repair protein MutL
MALIKPLPTELVSLIAAGEVIDSLAAVVRELIENAIDASATRISIAIDTENLANLSVQVADNGMGIDFENLQKAAAPHTTSKIATAQDLQDIHSLGFRGEALHSLAQLADLQICSRTESDTAGWQINFDRTGKPIEPPKTVAIAPGTIVQAQHIFKFYPNRLEALPSMSQQLRQVQLVIQLAAIAHPHITWQISLNQRDWFSIWAGQYVHDILPQIVRSIQPQDLVTGIINGDQMVKGKSDLVNPIDQIEQPKKFTYTDAISDPVKNTGSTTDRSDRAIRTTPEITITLGLPDRVSRHRLDWVKVMLNGRFVSCPELEQAIIAAFVRTLPRHRYPIGIVQLRLPPEKIDWNRSPAKTEVYIRDVEHYQQQISNLIGQMLRQPQRFILPKPIEINPLQDAAVGLLRETSVGYNSNPINNGDPSDLSDQVNSLTEHVPLVQSARVVAQVQDTYILIEHDRGLWLIEQHVAHERVLFEQLQDQWQVVELAQPIVLANLTERQIDRLRAISLEVEAFGDNLHVVRSLPQILVEHDDRQEILLELSQQDDLSMAMATVACRSAVRNGKKLEMVRLQEIFRQWQRTRNPHTCPHGRPICLSLDANDLARYFRRNWIVGKGRSSR